MRKEVSTGTFVFNIEKILEILLKEYQNVRNIFSS